MWRREVNICKVCLIARVVLKEWSVVYIVPMYKIKGD